MNATGKIPPQELEGVPDGPGHVPGRRLSRAVGFGLVGLLALLVRMSA